MKYKITLNDSIELLVVADSEVEAVKKAKEIKAGMSNDSTVKDGGTVISQSEAKREASKIADLIENIKSYERLVRSLANGSRLSDDSLVFFDSLATVSEQLKRRCLRLTLSTIE